MRTKLATTRARKAAVWPLVFAVVTLCSTSAFALPPWDTVIEQLDRFRAATGDLRADGQLTYGVFSAADTVLHRTWGGPPRLEVSGSTLLADWSNEDTDIVLRLLGAALSAADLGEAVIALGRTLSPEVHTLAIWDSVVVYVLGGPLESPVVHILVERDTYRLRRIDIPFPEGVYRVELNDYELAEGWFPRTLLVRREDRVLLRFEVSDLRRGSSR